MGARRGTSNPGGNLRRAVSLLRGNALCVRTAFWISLHAFNEATRGQRADSQRVNLTPCAAAVFQRPARSEADDDSARPSPSRSVTTSACASAGATAPT